MPSAPAPEHGDGGKRSHALGRFVVELPASARLVKLEEGDYDAKTIALFDVGDGGTLRLELDNRDPGELCARNLDSDVEVFRDAKVPGADRLERIRVGDGEALLAVGRAERPTPTTASAGVARIELCTAHELFADGSLALPNRDVDAAARADFLAMASSLRRRPVANVPSEQCTEKEVGAACVVACDQGDAMSCVKLGHLTYSGEAGVKQDRAAARKLFERACKAGLEKGCRALAISRSR